MYNTLFTPLTIGSTTLKNRIVFAPTSLGLSREVCLKKLTAIARGGCSMIIIADVPVGKHGSRSLSTKRGFAYYQELCNLLHAQDCKVCAQLHQSDSNLRAMLRYIPALLFHKISPDELRRQLNEAVGPYISTLPTQKVANLTSSFGTAATLAQKAGFDFIQVHGDRMCGSFSSSLFNMRTDRYGGSVRKRAQFAIDAISAIKNAVPDMPIDYKLAIRQEHPHYGNAGVLVDELPVFVPLLEKAGVTSFHVTLANHGQLSDTIPPANHPEFSEEGCFLKFCDEVRKLTILPICAVGGLTSPDFIESQLLNKRVDYIAMSRQLIADSDWPKKVYSGRETEISSCIRCNQDCLGGMQRHEGVHCIYDKRRTL